MIGNSFHGNLRGPVHSYKAVPTDLDWKINPTLFAVMSTRVLNPLHPTPSQPALQGERKKVAFITGAGQGIGRAIAIRIAQDGFDIAINDVNPTSLAETKAAAEAHGGRVQVLIGDVSDEKCVAEMIENVVSELGYLDVMVRSLTHFCSVLSAMGDIR